MKTCPYWILQPSELLLHRWNCIFNLLFAEFYLYSLDWWNFFSVKPFMCRSLPEWGRWDNNSRWCLKSKILHRKINWISFYSVFSNLICRCKKSFSHALCKKWKYKGLIINNYMPFWRYKCYLGGHRRDTKNAKNSKWVALKKEKVQTSEKTKNRFFAL